MNNEQELDLKVMVPARGWMVKYEDGSFMTEWNFQSNFSQLPNFDKIVGVGIMYDGRVWTIKGKKAYFAGKSWSAYLSFGLNIPPSLEGRYIGYWENGKQIIYKVDERTGKMEISVKEANA